jgi:hypothetical protein
MSDETLSEILAQRPLSINDAVSVLERIDGALSTNDGLKWFNLLYLMVTKEVLEHPPADGWSDPDWLARLDVNFAQLYLDALAAFVTSSQVMAKPWRVLFAARSDERIKRIQFALCGMNAHINRDLQFALVTTCQETGVFPGRDSGQFQDFQYVNRILEDVQPRILDILATGLINVIDEKLGDLDDILAMWSVRRARETAWLNGEILWKFRKSGFFRRHHTEVVDSFTSLAGRGLIVHV